MYNTYNAQFYIFLEHSLMLEFGTKFFSDERRYKKVNWKVNVRDHIITKFDCTVRFTRLSPKGITQEVLLKTIFKDISQR